jgi:hypothetical protein
MRFAINYDTKRIYALTGGREVRSRRKITDYYYLALPVNQLTERSWEGGGTGILGWACTCDCATAKQA